MPRPRTRTPELRARILEAAIEKLNDDGAGAVTARAVAEAAGTSAPAIYELYGDKAGLVRALFFEAHRRLLARFEALPRTADPVADVRAAAAAYRSFVIEQPQLFRVMYAEPFEVFSPTPTEQAVGSGTRGFLVGRLKRCIEAGVLAGDPTDVAHALLALMMGLAVQESGGWLGRTRRARDVRWRTALDALLLGTVAARTGSP